MPEQRVWTSQPTSDSNRTSAPAKGRNLCWLESSDGHRYYLDSVATVGRAEGSDATVVSQTVSRYHAILRHTGDHSSVTDLDSRNGTRVNDERISSPHRAEARNILLHVGDVDGSVESHAFPKRRVRIDRSTARESSSFDSNKAPRLASLRVPVTILDD